MKKYLFFLILVLVSLTSSLSFAGNCSKAKVWVDKYNATWRYNIDQAAFYLEKATRMCPEKVSLWVELSNIYHDKNEYTKALKYLNEALTYDPYNADVHESIGHIYLLMDKKKKGIQHFLKATNNGDCNYKNDSCRKASNSLAWIFSTCQKYMNANQAVKHAKNLIHNFTSMQGSSLHLYDISKAYLYADTVAASYARSGDFQNAIKYQSMAVKAAKNNKYNGLPGMIERLNLYKRNKPFTDKDCK